MVFLIHTTYYISHNSSNKRHDVKPNTLNRQYVNWTSSNKTRNSVQNETAATDGHHVITWQSASHGHIHSSVLMTLPSLQSPASLNELKTPVEKKRHLRVCEENFWGMVLIKQMLDIISCEIWNVFCRQAFVCRARGRDTVRAAASATFCKSGIKVRWALHIAACLSSLHYTAAQHVNSNALGTQPLVLSTSAALRTKSQTHLHNSK